MTPPAVMSAVGAILAYRAKYRGNERLPRKELELLQKISLQRLVSHAASHSPFYERLYKGIDPENFSLADLPITTKRAMMDNFDEFVTDRSLRRREIEAYIQEPRTSLFRDRFQIVHSGGSSGVMAIVVYDSRAWRIALSGVMRWMAYMNVPVFRLPRYRVVSIGGVGKTYASYKLSVGLDIGIARKRTLSAAADLQELIPVLNGFQPQLLMGVCSVIGALARAQEEGLLHLRPEIVATYAENKSAALDEAIRRVWGVRAFQQYSMIELLSLSSDCSEHQVHVSEDLGIVEVVDRNYRPVPDGQPGDRILITNLYNLAQPIIRYEIDDVLCFSPTRCACGRSFRVLSSIGGRSDEGLVFRKRDGCWTQITLANILDLTKEWPAIAQIKVVRDLNGVTIQTVLRKGAGTAEIVGGLRSRLALLLEERGIEPPDLRIEVVGDIARMPASGKTKMIEDLVLPLGTDHDKQLNSQGISRLKA